MSIEKDIELIQLVEQYKHIYNKKDDLYKDSIAVQNAWENIAKEINIPANDCQHRWETIKNRYDKEKKGLPSGSAGGMKKEWSCLKYLQFLQDVLVRRKRFGSFKNVSAPTETVVEEATEVDVDLSDYTEIGSDEPPAPKQICTGILSPEPSTSREPTPVSGNNTPRPRSRDSSLEKQLTTTVSNLSDFVSTVNARKSEQDSDMLFCSSLYETLRGITEKKKKNKAKIAILQSLDEFLED